MLLRASLAVMVVLAACSSGDEDKPRAGPPATAEAPPKRPGRQPSPEELREAEALVQMTMLVNQMCSCIDKRCADQAQERMTTWGMEMAKQAPATPTKPDEETSKRFSELGQRYAECMVKAMTNDAPTPPPGLPAECLAYGEAIERLANCRDLPEATRTAMRDAWKQTSQAWEDIPDSGKDALKTACKQASDAVVQATPAGCRQ